MSSRLWFGAFILVLTTWFVTYTPQSALSQPSHSPDRHNIKLEYAYLQQTYITDNNGTKESFEWGGPDEEYENATKEEIAKKLGLTVTSYKGTNLLNAISDVGWEMVNYAPSNSVNGDGTIVTRNIWYFRRRK